MPYREEHGGAVLNIAVARYSTARFQAMEEGHGITVRSLDGDTETTVTNASDLPNEGPLAFISAFIRRLIPDRTDYLLETDSEIPQRTGLGGSGAMGVALTALLSKIAGKELESLELAELANDVERTDFGSCGGSQDSYGSAVGGIKLITYAKGGGTSCERLTIPDDTRNFLQDNMLLIYTGEVHLSGSIHEDILAGYHNPDGKTKGAMDNLKDAANDMARALQAGDHDGFADNLNKTRINHYALHDSCDADILRHYFSELSEFVRAGKTSGAGGGGFIMILTHPGMRDACQQKAESLGALVWPLTINRTGVTVTPA